MGAIRARLLPTSELGRPEGVSRLRAGTEVRRPHALPDETIAWEDGGQRVT
jgi:hypothetical protein